MNPPTPVPPGWPASVRPPESPGWQRSAVAWLLDQCPHEYRGYPVIIRHPPALVRLTGHHVDSQLDAARRALASVRVDLAADLDPPAMLELIETLEAEQVRLLAARRAVALLADALRGRRYVPRL